MNRLPSAPVARCLVFGFLLMFLLAVEASAQGNCPGANGNDQEPDDAYIQACLNAGGTVVLDADVQFGYYIQSGLTLSTSSTTLTGTSAFGQRALLYATSDLAAPILDVDASTSNYTISNIMFFGNKYNRNGPYLCAEGNRWRATNVALRGSGFLVDNVESREAPCASSMSVETSNFEIRNSWFAFNGFPQEDRPGWNGPWADGLTVLNCGGGRVHDNHFIDNTDIDLVVGGGAGCIVESNTIEHYSTFGYGGIHVGWFPGYGGYFNGSVFQNNSVTTYTINKLATGIIVGFHPWDWHIDIHDPVVVSNASSGSVQNLIIDGVFGGYVHGNSMWGAQGTRGTASCPIAANYTAGDFNDSSFQDGWEYRIYHNGSCSQ
jgi:hypothetical protein